MESTNPNQPLWRATRQETPVFLDARGHRAVVARILGMGGAVTVAGALVMIVLAATGFSRVSFSPLHVLAAQHRTVLVHRTDMRRAARAGQPSEGVEVALHRGGARRTAMGTLMEARRMAVQELARRTAAQATARVTPQSARGAARVLGT